MTEFIRFDRQSDALASLQEFHNCLLMLSHNPLSWKFAIISIHNALQAYICISLRNGNSFQYWKPHSLKKWMKAYRGKNNLPNTQLDYFMELFDKRFASECTIDRNNILWLNHQRNIFVHFNTGSYSLHQSSALLCCQEAFRAVKLTPSLADGLFFYDEEQKHDFANLCDQISECFLTLKPR